jgi:hypothetical protein
MPSVALLILAVAVGAQLSRASEVLFNFTDSSSTDAFYEVSDTARSVGMSMGVISLIESEIVRRASFFALLNPQEDGACFAGVSTEYQPAQSWTPYTLLSMQLRAQGGLERFKVVLHDAPNWANSSLAFEQYFQMDPTPRNNTVHILTNHILSNHTLSNIHYRIIYKLSNQSLSNIHHIISGGVYNSFSQAD